MRRLASIHDSKALNERFVGNWIEDADIWHAVRNATRKIDMDNDLTMLIGPRRTDRYSRSACWT